MGEFHLNSYDTNGFQTQDHENGVASGIKRCCPLKGWLVAVGNVLGQKNMLSLFFNGLGPLET